MTEVDLVKNPWERLQDLVEAGDSDHLLEFLNSINPMDTALAISRLRLEDQGRLLVAHPERGGRENGLEPVGPQVVLDPQPVLGFEGA